MAQTDPRRGRLLSREIDSFVKQRQRQNKILAKNVAEWVDTAMTINANMQEQAGDGASMADFEEVSELSSSAASAMSGQTGERCVSVDPTVYILLITMVLT